MKITPFTQLESRNATSSETVSTNKNQRANRDARDTSREWKIFSRWEIPFSRNTLATKRGCFCPLVAWFLLKCNSRILSHPLSEVWEWMIILETEARPRETWVSWIGLVHFVAKGLPSVNSLLCQFAAVCSRENTINEVFQLTTRILASQL